MSAEDIDARLAAVVTPGLEANAALEEVASEYHNVHVVDFYGRVEQVHADGLELSDRTLTIDRFGGLVGLDLLHFTDTGYAVLADLYVDKLNELLGLEIPPIDVEAIHAADLERIEGYAAAGVDVTACE